MLNILSRAVQFSSKSARDREAVPEITGKLAGFMLPNTLGTVGLIIDTYLRAPVPIAFLDIAESTGPVYFVIFLSGIVLYLRTPEVSGRLQPVRRKRVHDFVFFTLVHYVPPVIGPS